jgi:hypothetical protein
MVACHHIPSPLAAAVYHVAALWVFAAYTLVDIRVHIEDHHRRHHHHEGYGYLQQEPDIPIMDGGEVVRPPERNGWYTVGSMGSVEGPLKARSAQQGLTEHACMVPWGEAVEA